MPQIEGPSYLILFVWVLTGVVTVMTAIIAWLVTRYIQQNEANFKKLFSDNMSLKQSIQHLKFLTKSQGAEIKELKRRSR